MASGSIARPYCSESRASSARARFTPPLSQAPPSAPSTTFSTTLSVSTSMKCWWTMPMPSAIASAGVRMRQAWPPTAISPASAS